MKDTTGFLDHMNVFVLASRVEDFAAHNCALRTISRDRIQNRESTASRKSLLLRRGDFGSSNRVWL